MLIPVNYLHFYVDLPKKKAYVKTVVQANSVLKNCSSYICMCFLGTEWKVSLK